MNAPTSLPDQVSTLLAMFRQAAAQGQDPETLISCAWRLWEEQAYAKHTEIIPPPPPRPLISRPISAMRIIYSILDSEPEWSSDELGHLGAFFDDLGWTFHDIGTCDNPHCAHHHHEFPKPDFTGLY